MFVRTPLFLVLLAAVVVLAALTVAPASAQLNSICEFVGTATDGAILVDIPVGASPDDVAIRCNILLVNGEPDTSENDQGAIGTSGTNPASYISAVDLFLISSKLNGYGFFNQPVRVCFKVENPETAVVIIEEARTAFESVLDEPGRSVSILQSAPEGIELGYACGDTIVPGIVSVHTPNANPYPFLLEDADRCDLAGDPSCRSALGAP